MAKKRLIDAYDLAEIIENMKITVAGKPARWDDAKHSVLREIAQAPDVDVIDRPKWISVEERLPEENVRVLVLLEPDKFHTKIDTDRLINSRWVRWSSYVTHWSPIPESLKEGAKE